MTTALIAEGKTSYFSGNTETMEEKKALFNAIERCDNLLSEFKGQNITIKNVYAEKFISKEGNEKFRTIIFDKDGKTFASTSYGVYNSLGKIIGAMGEPSTWTEALEVKVEERPLGNGRKLMALTLA